MSDERFTVALGDRRYAVYRKWARLPPGDGFGFVSDLAVDGDGRVHVAQRGTDRPILVFERDGSYAGAWGAGVIAEPHYITYTPDDGGFLVADRDAHQLLRFNGEKRLVQTLGQRHWPSLDAPFNHPTAGALAPGGDIFVADGYGNARVHRFAADGRLLHSWGRRGRRPGEFSTPHAVAVDRRGRVLVADRENDRVQVFDADGNVLAVWDDVYRPMKIWIDERRDLVFVSDQVPRITMFTPDGELVGRCRGAINGAHGLAGDAEGNLYLAELPPQEVSKLEGLW
jgi:DNA-binding beta-propeller fold protein YncE